jgi:hypothetical protein
MYAFSYIDMYERILELRRLMRMCAVDYDGYEYCIEERKEHR